MQTSGRGSSEKAMIIIPAVVLLFVMVVVTGGPVQFIRFLNNELREALCAGISRKPRATEALHERECMTRKCDENITNKFITGHFS